MEPEQPATRERLLGIRERLAKASPGPWSNVRHDVPSQDQMTSTIKSLGLTRGRSFQTIGRMPSYQDAAFAAGAREDVPFLLDLVTWYARASGHLIDVIGNAEFADAARKASAQLLAMNEEVEPVGRTVEEPEKPPDQPQSCSRCGGSWRVEPSVEADGTTSAACGICFGVGQIRARGDAERLIRVVAFVGGLILERLDRLEGRIG